MPRKLRTCDIGATRGEFHQLIKMIREADVDAANVVVVAVDVECVDEHQQLRFQQMDPSKLPVLV